MKYLKITSLGVSIISVIGCSSKTVIHKHYNYLDTHIESRDVTKGGDTLFYLIDVYKGGAIRSKCQYVNDVENGWCKWWYETGELWSTGKFKDGKHIGYHKLYAKDGLLIEKTKFNRKGNELWYRSYNDSTSAKKQKPPY